MKKTLSSIIIAAMLLSVLAVSAFAADLSYDFNTADAQAKVEFFGTGCALQTDAGTSDATVIYLVNKASDGSDATAANGGIYNNGAKVTFESANAGEATLNLKLICPDHVNGAAGYCLFYRSNGNDYAAADLKDVNNHEFFNYEIKVNVTAGTNTLSLVQGVGGDHGNGWRLDVASIDFTLPAAAAEKKEVTAAYMFDAAYLKANGSESGNNMTAAYGDAAVFTITDGNDPYISIASAAEVPGGAQYAVIKYKSTAEQSCEFFCGNGGGAVGGDESEFFGLAVSEDWAYVTVNLNKDGGNKNWSDVNNYFRFDASAVGTITVDYIAFFTSADDAAALADGSATLAVKGDTPVTADAAIIVVAAVAALALAGIVVVKKVRA